jgi:hypothetical protein
MTLKEEVKLLREKVELLERLQSLEGPNPAPSYPVYPFWQIPPHYLPYPQYPTVTTSDGATTTTDINHGDFLCQK